jgi:uncharacterized RDD family membrane protein YckC
MSAGDPPPPPPPPSTPPPVPPAGAVYARGRAPLPPWLTLSSGAKRFGAFLLDVLLAIVTLIIGWLIWAIILWGHGQTPAKQLLRMRIVDLNTGRGASWGPMALRELVGRWLLGNVTCGISTLVGGVMILSDERRQAIWDKIANTVVVEDPYNQLDPN